MLNLACGSRMHRDWNNLDFSPMSRLAKHMFLAGLLHNVGLLSGKRFHRLSQILPDTIKWDLRKGIPFEDNTFDVLYHSHFIEHLHQKVAGEFLKECRRVLKVSGIIRVVVPNLEMLCREYLDTFQLLAGTESTVPGAMEKHEQNIRNLLSQMVASEPGGTAEQGRFVRNLERFIRGDTSRTGDIHRWMYDKYTLQKLLLIADFKDVRVESESTGRIPGWPSYCLDTNKDGSPYKRESIYAEGIK